MKFFQINTRIYNLSSGSHITRFSAVVAKFFFVTLLYLEILSLKISNNVRYN